MTTQSLSYIFYPSYCVLLDQQNEMKIGSSREYGGLYCWMMIHSTLI